MLEKIVIRIGNVSDILLKFYYIKKYNKNIKVKNHDFGVCFKLPARASGFEVPTRLMRASKHNLLCSGEQKIFPKGQILINHKKIR